MKRIYLLVLFISILLPFNIKALEDDNKLLENATSGLLMEQSTGEIIYKKNINKKVPVASMTKMVVQTIILENIESGKIKWNDVVEVSKNAADMGGSQIYLTAGEKMSIKDLFKGISMASANDATVAMAEYLAGSEEKFVKKMNQKIRSLGLKNTQFKNSTGLDEDGHYSSAYDMAIIARNLLNHEQILQFSSVYEDYLREDTENKFWLDNTNKLVRYYEGADGLKTGHTDNAGYCLAATAKKNDMRLIAIVLGEEDSKTRNSEAMQLLDYGFNNKKIMKLKDKNALVKEIKIDKGNKDKVGVITKDSVGVLQDKVGDKNKYTYNVKLNNITLPIKKGDTLGKINIYEKDKYINSVDLISDSDVDKLNYFELYIDTMKDSILGIVS